MTTFVLVHGGWHGGWCWERVMPLLAAAGNEVATPTLIGLGDRVAEARADIGVDDHAADIVAAVRAAQPPVILVAHSYSGAPAEVAAARIPGLLARIVHLDSFAVASGESIGDVFPPPMLAAMRAQAAETGDGWQVDPLPPVALGLEQPDDVAFVVPRLTGQSLRTIVEPVRIDSGGESVPRTYVECLVGAETKPFGFYAARARERGWDYRCLNAGHDAMVTAPDALARLLLEIAAPATVRTS
jgi:pimeloyl-ACP methyl ester carboxylesterase